jgi:glycerol-3-phosphate acyltransferase PlsX
VSARDAGEGEFSSGGVLPIAVDAMGGDYAPGEIVQGAIEAARDYRIPVTLVGQEERIRAELARSPTAGLPLSVVHADEVIAMDEHPTDALRRKRGSSLIRVVELVRDGRAAGAVSAGNSGAMMAAALFILKRLPGVDRPVLAAPYPTHEGKCLLLDVGANTDCKPRYLVQFALMGSVYSEHVFGVQRPRIGLLANGEEDTKGNRLVQVTHALLKDAAVSGLDFIGNIEGKDIPRGAADVVVMDGFVGNVALKLSEGLAEMIFGAIRTELSSGIMNQLAAAVLRPAFRRLYKRLDYEEYGGSPLLGVDGVAIIAHGRSKARAIKNAIRVAQQAAQTDTPAAIAAGLARIPGLAGAVDPEPAAPETP